MSVFPSPWHDCMAEVDSKHPLYLFIFNKPSGVMGPVQKMSCFEIVHLLLWSLLQSSSEASILGFLGDCISLVLCCWQKLSLASDRYWGMWINITCSSAEVMGEWGCRTELCNFLCCRTGSECAPPTPRRVELLREIQPSKPLPLPLPPSLHVKSIFAMDDGIGCHTYT